VTLAGGEPELFLGGDASDGQPPISVIDLAFGPDDSLYVLDIFGGALHRVPVDGAGVPGAIEPLVTAGLAFPVGVAVDVDGTVYVANCGISVLCGEDAGQLVQVDPADADASALAAPPARAAGAARAALEELGLR